MSVIVLLLVAAVVIILVTQLMNNGVKKIDRTQFQTYVENSQYLKEDGTPNEKDGKIVSIADPE